MPMPPDMKHWQRRSTASPMRDTRRFSLALNLEDELQAEAYATLRNAPRGSRTNLICRAVLAYGNNSRFLEEVRQMIRDEMSNIGPISMTPIQRNTNDSKAGQIDEDVLGFLRSLEGDDDG